MFLDARKALRSPGIPKCFGQHNASYPDRTVSSRLTHNTPSFYHCTVQKTKIASNSKCFVPTTGVRSSRLKGVKNDLAHKRLLTMQRKKVAIKKIAMAGDVVSAKHALREIRLMR